MKSKIQNLILKIVLSWMFSYATNRVVFGLPTIAYLFYLVVLYNVLLQYFRFYNEAFCFHRVAFYSPHRDYPYAYHSQSLLLLICKRKKNM